MSQCGIEVALAGWSDIVAWLDKWQTLITGFMALGAAVVALQPVRKQLALMRTQSKVMFRETIGKMITQLDLHCESMSKITEKPVSDIHSSLWHFEQNGDKGIEHWGYETSSKIDRMQFELKTLFVTAHDVAAVEKEKDNLLSVVRNLSSNLRDMVAPISATFFHERTALSEEEMTALDARSVKARKELDDRVSQVSMLIQQLSDAYTNQRVVLVRQLRVIDDEILNRASPKNGI